MAVCLISIVKDVQFFKGSFKYKVIFEEKSPDNVLGTGRQEDGQLGLLSKKLLFRLVRSQLNLPEFIKILF